MGTCTWEKKDGRYVCMAKHCPHWDNGNCLIGKVTLSCDNEECIWNSIGNHHCKCMEVHLDADGKCLGLKEVLRNGNKT